MPQPLTQFVQVVAYAACRRLVLHTLRQKRTERGLSLPQLGKRVARSGQVNGAYTDGMREGRKTHLHSGVQNTKHGQVGQTQYLGRE